MTHASHAADPRSASRYGGWSAQTVWCVVLAIACVWFFTLGTRHLLRSDEGRYAEIAREMWASGDWITVRYNGLKYFEKPPFQMWMTALAYQAFGVGEWQARLWVSVCGAVGAGMTMLAARRWYGLQVGLLTGLVLLAAPTWNVGSHFNSLDMSVSGALACVLAGVLLAQHPQTTPKARRAWMWFAWAAIGVAILTKGLIGIVLPGLVLVVYTLAARDWALWRRLHLVSGALVAGAVAAPWFVIVSLRNPEFPQFFFIHEHWQRYTSTLHQRGAPVWYFVPQLVAGFLPWIGLSPRLVSEARRDAEGIAFKPALLMGVWAATIFAFFSLSNSKLPGYIMPIFPALAVLAALALDKLDARTWSRLVFGMLIVAVIGTLISAGVALFGVGVANTPYRHYVPWVAAACGLAVAGLAVALAMNRRGHRAGSIAMYSLTLFASTTLGLVGHETLGRGSSGADLVPAMQAVLTPQMPIYSVRLLDHTLPFYLQRTTIMVEAPDELEFGVRQEPQKWIPTVATFVQQWSTGQPALAIMLHETYASLRAQNVTMFPIAEDARRVVVANFPKTRP